MHCGDRSTVAQRSSSGHRRPNADQQTQDEDRAAKPAMWVICHLPTYLPAHFRCVMHTRIPDCSSPCNVSTLQAHTDCCVQHRPAHLRYQNIPQQLHGIRTPTGAARTHQIGNSAQRGHVTISRNTYPGLLHKCISHSGMIQRYVQHSCIGFQG